MLHPSGKLFFSKTFPVTMHIPVKRSKKFLSSQQECLAPAMCSRIIKAPITPRRPRMLQRRSNTPRPRLSSMRRIPLITRAIRSTHLTRPITVAMVIRRTGTALRCRSASAGTVAAGAGIIIGTEGIAECSPPRFPLGEPYPFDVTLSHKPRCNCAVYVLRACCSQRPIAPG